MKHLIDNETGVLVLIPENNADSELIYRLINSPDLTQFSTYCELENKLFNKPMTVDLGVHVDNIEYYPMFHNPEDTRDNIWWLDNWDKLHDFNCIPSKTNSTVPDCGDLPDEERCLLGELIIYGNNTAEKTTIPFFRGTGQHEIPVELHGASLTMQ